MDSKQINEFIAKNKGMDYAEIAQKTGISVDAVRKRYRKIHPPKRVTSQNRDIIENPKIKKEGIESRNDDRVIINWTTKTVVTNCGEFGNIVTSFAKHALIQRMYSNEYNGGKGATQSEVAREFVEFPHAKAVAIYAKLHGFTKSDLGQTDIEFELGLTEEEAVEENLQARKRRAARLTEAAKWKQQQADADKWNNFEHSVIEPLVQNLETKLPRFTTKPLKLTKQKEETVVTVGITDWHFMKLAFGHNGKEVYNQQIAEKGLDEAVSQIMERLLRFGSPKKIVLPVGTDNLHVDGVFHTTTKGTPQARQTVGDWSVAVDVYVNIYMRLIDYLSQVAPVELVVMPGNHDYQTSVMLGVLLKTTYKNNKSVSVVHAPTSPRIYLQYGSVLNVYTHGDDISHAKMDREAFKYLLAEAREQGIRIDSVKHVNWYSGHEHTHYVKDIGGIRRFVFPTIAAEDSWHKSSGYVGNKRYFAADIVDTKKGAVATVYSDSE